MTRTHVGTKRILRPDNVSEANVPLYADSELVSQASYLLRYLKSRQDLVPSSPRLKDFKTLNVYGTDFPDYRPTANGKYFAGNTIHGDEGEGKHTILIDERLEPHEKLATLTHELAHVTGGYISSAQERETHQLAIETLHTLYSNYENLAEPSVQKALKEKKVQFNPYEIPKEVVARALGYLANSASAFGITNSQLAQQGVFKRANSSRGLESRLGLFTIIAGLLIFLIKPMNTMTGFVIAENVTNNLGSSIYLLGLALVFLGGFLFRKRSLR